jgi:GMP synthase (glutamine-hydrolysing)
MKILFVVHASFEKPGCIESWAHKQGHYTRTVSPYKGERLPDINEFDLLVVMGGPQSSLELDKAPYLYDEIGLIEQAIKEQKRILGVCLGAQLIAEALGAKPERSPHREIGMYPVELLDSAKGDPVFSHFPSKFDVMHWHSDMPGIPTGAVLLAKSEGCPRQAFRYGDRIYGFQCHFELTLELVNGMIANCVEDLAKPGDYIRSAKELIESDYSQINSKMEFVLDYLAKLPEPTLQDKSQPKFSFKV